MSTATHRSPAAEWASRVSDRRYRKTRHELDELVVSTVPAYAAIVDEELDRFEQAALKLRVRLDAPYQASWSINPAVDNITKLLTALVIIFIAISVGLTFPGGARTGVSIPDEWRPAMITMSSVAFTIAAVAQLARWVPYLHHVPPKDGLAWVMMVLGIPVVAWMAWLQQHNSGIPLGAVILAAAALLASVIGCFARLARRLRDRPLTKKVDAGMKERRKALRTGVVSLVNASANRLVEKFAALPEQSQSRLREELGSAAAQLEARRLMTAPATNARPRAVMDRRNRRGIFPGLLMLAHRIDAVNSQTGTAAQWIVGDYVDDPTINRSRD